MNSPSTPFFLYDKNILKENLARYGLKKFHLNYSVKSCSCVEVLQEVEPWVDGFTVTSVRDLNSVRELSDKNIHYVSPMIRKEEIEAISSKGNSVSFNSIESFERLYYILDARIKILLRINPELSFLDDERYNPCRNYSKLGIYLKNFIRYLDTNPLAARIHGIHFHTNCQSEKPEELIETFSHIENMLNQRLSAFEEINMGGGYLCNDSLMEIVNRTQEQWRKKYGISLRMEPSFDITNSAGFLCSSVVDIFRSQDKTVAILDTSTNHLPEVFEYGECPDILTPTTDDGGHCHILAGATCLAGDIFGEYAFEQPLRPSDRIVFKNVGAYSLVRANTFNGIPLPENYVDSVEIFFNGDGESSKGA